MFEARRNRSTIGLMFSLAEVMYVSTVRKVRQSHGNAVLSIGLSLFQSALFLAAFYFMFSFMGTRTAAIRGSFLLYLMSGIFLYLTHIQTVRSVMNAESSTSAMMQHAPMNTMVGIVSAAASTLYVQTLSLLVMLFVMHTALEPIEIHRWAPAFLMYILAWFSGIGVGLVFMALKPWIPDVMGIVQMVYIRANMIASGKMFVANMLPNFMVHLFAWNPLFHAIDQGRGFIFVNYFPHNTNWQYPLYFSLVFILLGLMGDFYTRKRASASWGATR